MKKLPRAIICDLDGTIAILNGRDPYNASTCEQDLVNMPVARIVGLFFAMSNYQVFFTSGRSDKYKEESVRWVFEKAFQFKSSEWSEYVIGKSARVKFLMRKHGDDRKDSIVKQEMYDNEIKGKYEVDFVLDDRQQVVDMWRANGLTCLQVAPGNF